MNAAAIPTPTDGPLCFIGVFWSRIRQQEYSDAEKESLSVIIYTRQQCNTKLPPSTSSRLYQTVFTTSLLPKKKSIARKSETKQPEERKKKPFQFPSIDSAERNLSEMVRLRITKDKNI